MKRFALMLLLAVAAFAADLTGKWTGSFDVTAPDGSLNPGGAYMDLKVSGPTVTGTAGPAEAQQHEILNGKLDGKKLTFEVSASNGSVIKFDLTFDGDSIKGAASGENDGQKMSAKVDLKRKP